MTVPRTGVICATIIDREHGAQDEESLDEAEDLGLPVLTGVTTPQSRLKPVWIFHGFLVDGVNTRGEFFLDDLAVVLSQQRIPNLAASAAMAAALELRRTTYSGSLRENLYGWLSTELHRHRRKH